MDPYRLGLLPPGNPPQPPQNRPNRLRQMGIRNPSRVANGPRRPRHGGTSPGFPKAKDRPVVITALAAEAAVLLTLDRTDFHVRWGGKFTG